MFQAMKENKIEPKIMREVIQRKGKEPSLILLEGKKGAMEGFRILPPLYIEDDNGNYSEESDSLFNAYKVKEL